MDKVLSITHYCRCQPETITEANQKPLTEAKSETITEAHAIVCNT